MFDELHVFMYKLRKVKDTLLRLANCTYYNISKEHGEYNLFGKYPVQTILSYKNVFFIGQYESVSITS